MKDVNGIWVKEVGVRWEQPLSGLGFAPQMSGVLSENGFLKDAMICTCARGSGGVITFMGGLISAVDRCGRESYGGVHKSKNTYKVRRIVQGVRDKIFHVC